MGRRYDTDGGGEDLAANDWRLVVALYAALMAVPVALWLALVVFA